MIKPPRAIDPLARPGGTVSLTDGCHKLRNVVVHVVIVEQTDTTRPDEQADDDEHDAHRIEPRMIATIPQMTSTQASIHSSKSMSVDDS